MLLNGSGEVLISARVPVLAMWLPAASVPPSSAGDGRHFRPELVGRAERQQRARRDAHEGVQHVVQAVDQRDLVGEEIEREQQRRRGQHPGRAEHLQVVRQARRAPAVCAPPRTSTAA